MPDCGENLRSGSLRIRPFELSLTADASRVRFVNSALDGGMFGSQGGPCDPFAKNDARGTRAS